MNRLEITASDKAQSALEKIYSDVERRMEASPVGNCPVELTSAFVKLCLAQSCGKCVPCRVGLDKLAALMDGILDGEGSERDLELLLQFMIPPIALLVFKRQNLSLITSPHLKTTIFHI